MNTQCLGTYNNISTQCLGKTKRGLQCRIRTKDTSSRCHFHREKIIQNNVGEPIIKKNKPVMIINNNKCDLNGDYKIVENNKSISAITSGKNIGSVIIINNNKSDNKCEIETNNKYEINTNNKCEINTNNKCEINTNNKCEINTNNKCEIKPDNLENNNMDNNIEENDNQLVKDNECVICFEPIINDIITEDLICCTHTQFHKSCLEKHFKPECPICKTPNNLDITGILPQSNISIFQSDISAHDSNYPNFSILSRDIEDGLYYMNQTQTREMLNYMLGRLDSLRLLPTTLVHNI